MNVPRRWVLRWKILTYAPVVSVLLMAVLVSPGNAQSLSNTELFLENNRVAETLLQSGNYHHARLLLEHNLAMFPRSPSQIKAIADIDLKWGRHVEIHRNPVLARPFYEKSHEMYEQALQLFSEEQRTHLEDPTVQDIYIGMAKAKAMSRAYEEAVMGLQDILLRQPEHVEANYWLGVVRRMQLDDDQKLDMLDRDGQIYEIDSYFTKALRYNDGSTYIPLAYIFVGLLDFQAGASHLAEARLLEGTRQMEAMAAIESIGEPMMTEFEQKYYDEARALLRRLRR